MLHAIGIEEGEGDGDFLIRWEAIFGVKPAPILLTLSKTAVQARPPLFGDTKADPTKVARTNFLRSLSAAMPADGFPSARFIVLSITD